MPPVIPIIAGAFVASAVAGAAIFAGVTIAGVAAGTLVGAIAGGLTSAVLSRALADKPQAPASAQLFEEQARGALINSTSTVDPVPVIYGTRRVGGTRVFTEVSGSSKEFLNLVIVLAEGEISAINTVYIDEVASTDARFSGLTTIEKHTGTDDQAASPALISELPAAWTADHRLRGFAYLYLKLKFSESAFNGLPTITADVDGKLVLDPRDSTTKFSNNPALCLRDALTNARYGRGIPAAAMDDDSFSAAANVCDELVSTPAGNQKRYTCDGILSTDADLIDNVNALLGSCRGLLVFSAGKYRLVIDKSESAIAFTFTEDNIVGGWAIQNASKRSRANRVKARFFNPDRRWQPDLAIFDSSADRASDNGLLLESEIALPFTSNLYRAQQLAMLAEKASRFGVACRFRATIAGMQCEVGDVVNITHSTPGWTAKPFRVTRIELLNSDEVEVTAREYQDAAYSLDTLATATVVPATNLPNPFSVAAPSGLTLTSGTAELFVAGDGTVHSRIKAVWTLAPDIFVTQGGHVEIQFKKTAGSPEQDWSPSLFFDGSLTQAFLDPVDDGDTYSVRIRFENKLGVRSAFTTGSHIVVGKTAVPADVTGYTAQQNGNVVVFRWNQVSDLDLAGYEIRYGAAGIAWADATPLTQVTRGTQITTAAVPPGSWKTMIKAKDTSGNFSATEAAYSLTVSNEFDVIQESEQAPRWSGARVNFVKHWTGVLIPDSTKLASAHTKAELFEQFVPYPFATCTYEAPEMGLAFDADVRLWADIGSALGPGVTSGIADPQLQVDHRKGATAYDGYEDWTIGTVNARYVKHRLVLDTARGKAKITGFKTVLDAEEKTIGAKDVTVGVGGSVIGFSPQFHLTPRVAVVAQAAAGAARYATWESPSATGFTARVFNSGGSDVGGTVNWDATGV